MCSSDLFPIHDRQGEGPDAPDCVTDITFRTATSPIRPGGFQILGTKIDGTQFSVTADLDGKFISDSCVGTIDYEVGMIRLWFIKRIYDADWACVED